MFVLFIFNFVQRIFYAINIVAYIPENPVLGATNIVGYMQPPDETPYSLQTRFCWPAQTVRNPKNAFPSEMPGIRVQDKGFLIYLSSR